MSSFGFGMCYFFCIWFYVWSCSFDFVKGISVVGTLYVDGTSSIGKIDNDFICATMDWWPPEKCDFGTCPWGKASMLNVDLSNEIFFNAIKAFSPLKIRLGGTLQDRVIYETEDHQQPCVAFSKKPVFFGFTQGCLPLSRWDELNSFFNRTGALVIFGLNALSGKSIRRDGFAVGKWNYTNAESLMRYTLKKGYQIHGWELGNELCGKGIWASITAENYASDTQSLRELTNRVYNGIQQKPLILAPGGFFNENWFKKFIPKANNSLDVTTLHNYNLGPGKEEHLTEKILNVTVLDNAAWIFRNLQSIIKKAGTPVTAWVGEAGGVYGSGRNLVSNRFVNSFWYLDQLGMTSSLGMTTYCRQSLIGGNYGLLDTTTFVPNPDYYSALLWHRLMGRNVLSTKFTGTKNVRTYAHCAKQSIFALQKGITVLLINLNNSTTIETEFIFSDTFTSLHEADKKTLDESKMSRVEYHLTPKDGDLHSQDMLLNGNMLALDSNGNIPPLKGMSVNSSQPLSVDPLSIVFVHFPNVDLPACR